MAAGRGGEAALLSDAEALRGGLTDGLREASGAVERLTDAATNVQVKEVADAVLIALDEVRRRAQTHALAGGGRGGDEAC